MPLTPGTRLGTYEIISPLGAGGMGEVYRARDLRLRREVAVKVLPQDLTATPELRARFEREAHTISSLNHPNICTLFDFGHEGDTEYLVMELVEGQTLADRLVRGPLPTSEVLRVGTQIADALEAAHKSGIVHRDLKPGNIMLSKTGTMLLDFGLARAAGLGPGPAGQPDSPTVSEPLTAEGTIVGTFLYIAPEQLEGNDADARSDIWALGCVLYEMITGIRPFQGKSRASLISAIMSADPAPIAPLAPMSPPALERLVKACLAKDPEQRIQTTHDVKLQLQWIAEGGSQAGVPALVVAKRGSHERLAWTLAAAFAAALSAVLVANELRPVPPAKPVIFELAPPHQAREVDLPRISPDGRRLAFNATDSMGVTCIWVREMDSLEARRLQGTEGATRPFWSPDSRFLAFFTGGRLCKVDINGGPPIAVCDAPRGADGSWSPRGLILFDGSAVDSIQCVSASGGVPTAATRIDRKNHEAYTAWPQFLPDSRHFLYVAYGSGPEAPTLKVGSIGSKETKTLGPAGSRTEYASGHLLYVQGGHLLAHPFDTGALKFTGDPLQVAEGVEANPMGSARFSASSQGTLVYRGGHGGVNDRLIWTNRRGEWIGAVGDPAIYDVPALSPDGTQLAVGVGMDPTQAGDIWLWDLTRNLGSRFTFVGQNAGAPVWSPDGSRVAYSLGRGGSIDLHWKEVGGGGVDSLLYASDEQKIAGSWSTDGQWLAYNVRSAKVRRWDIYALSLGGSPRPVPIATTPFAEIHPAISPDGRWIAYASDESGQFELYVQPFPGPGRKWRVSTQGALEPAWRGDGKELFYLTPGSKMMVVAVVPGLVPRLSLPRQLFDTPLGPPAPTRNRYAVTRDGQRFLFVVPQAERQGEVMTVVLDWPGRLKPR